MADKQQFQRNVAILKPCNKSKKVAEYINRKRVIPITFPLFLDLSNSTPQRAIIPHCCGLCKMPKNGCVCHYFNLYSINQSFIKPVFAKNKPEINVESINTHQEILDLFFLRFWTGKIHSKFGNFLTFCLSPFNVSKTEIPSDTLIESKQFNG